MRSNTTTSPYQDDPSRKPQNNQAFGTAAGDSDEHDDFNPIEDLMPPTTTESGLAGKKRGRENDPLRRLIEESSADESNTNQPVTGSPQKRQKGVVDQVNAKKNSQEDESGDQGYGRNLEVRPNKGYAPDKQDGLMGGADERDKMEVPEFSPPNAKKGGANSRVQTFGQGIDISSSNANQINLSGSPEERQEPPRKKKKSNKTVRWAAQEHLEEVKYFKMNDEPNKAGLSLAEVQEIQKHLADVPAHLIPSEIQKIEMQLDGRLLRERKS